MVTQTTSAVGNSQYPSMPEPVWNYTGKRGYGALFAEITREIRTYATLYLRYRGNKIAYLRHQGVRIGIHCDILTSVKNFCSEPWLIDIGNRVTLAPGVIFLTHDGANRVFRHLMPGSSPWGNLFGPIRIADNAFIGARSILMPGVSIGHNSIVGTGSLVTRDVPPDTVVAGVPARPMCTLTEYIERYKQKMIPIKATDRRQLREELTQHFFGEIR